MIQLANKTPYVPFPLLDFPIRERLMKSCFEAAGVVGVCSDERLRNAACWNVVLVRRIIEHVSLPCQ